VVGRPGLLPGGSGRSTHWRMNSQEKAQCWSVRPHSTEEFVRPDHSGLIQAIPLYRQASVAGIARVRFTATCPKSCESGYEYRAPISEPDSQTTNGCDLRRETHRSARLRCKTGLQMSLLHVDRRSVSGISARNRST